MRQVPSFNIDIYKYLNEIKLLKPGTYRYRLPNDIPDKCCQEPSKG